MKLLGPRHNFYIISLSPPKNRLEIVELMIIMGSPNVKLVHNKADPIRHKCYINGPNFKI